MFIASVRFELLDLIQPFAAITFYFGKHDQHHMERNHGKSRKIPKKIEY